MSISKLVVGLQLLRHLTDQLSQLYLQLSDTLRLKWQIFQILKFLNFAGGNALLPRSLQDVRYKH